MSARQHSITIIGYHGTSSQNIESITKDGLRPSEGDNHWLGDGCYFFIEGIDRNPKELAKKWSIATAWDNKLKKHTYQEYCVYECIIKARSENILNLTEADGYELFKYVREIFIEKVQRHVKIKRAKGIDYLDGKIMNFAVKELGLKIEVCIGNFYIKFTEERIMHYDQRTPNCTVCAVLDPKKNIHKHDVVVTETIEL